MVSRTRARVARETSGSVSIHVCHCPPCSLHEDQASLDLNISSYLYRSIPLECQRRVPQFRNTVCPSGITRQQEAMFSSGPSDVSSRETRSFPRNDHHPVGPRDITSSKILQPRTLFEPKCLSSGAPRIALDTFDSNFAQHGSPVALLAEEKTESHLQRQRTLISPLSLPSRTAAELAPLLGDTNGRLKAGATVLPHNQRCPSHKKTSCLACTQRPDHTILERAKHRPRIELDFRLAGDTFVQGQCISGNLTIHIHKHAKTMSPVLLANHKLRVIGFECLPDGHSFHVFFHYSCRFDEVSFASEQIFSESPDYSDEEGYREAREGTHVLPFEITLPVDPRYGRPRGVINVHGGVAVRYIIMASAHVKDPDSQRLSLAHFYRPCSIWPFLSIMELLAPSSRALVSTAALSFPEGDSCTKLRLSARLPRLFYLAGQHCYVHIQVSNNTRKTVRSALLTLIRTTTSYKPKVKPKKHGSDGSGVCDLNAYEIRSFAQETSESRLAVADRASKRRAGSAGWWMGVGPG
ncbi:hypothetical protein BC834DRAFT_24794 [Gloeopeniophorella convolvens]|nr:hypothetical protein BC834DRAFT_24794 [Gloeopeniophorella convolvens]